MKRILFFTYLVVSICLGCRDHTLVAERIHADTATQSTESQSDTALDSDSETVDSDDSDSVDTASPMVPERPIFGADVSWIQEDEAAGAVYYDNDNQADILDIFTAHSLNFIRLQLLVDSAAEGGYAETMDAPYGDLAHALEMAERAQNAGMGILIAFHCSDTGASAGVQIKPSSWEGHDFEQLQTDVYAHINSSVSALIDNGTRPDLVQIGNEIGQAFVRPEGSISNPEQYAALLKAGIQGVKDAEATIPVILHHQQGRNNADMVSWLETLFSNDVTFDIIGASTFAETEPGQYLANFTDLATRYPDYKFISLAHSGDDIQVIHEVMAALPDNRGLGAFIYGPTRYGTSPIFNCEAECSEDSGPTGGRYDTNAYIDLYPDVAVPLY